jgi:chromosome partitioning protein
MKSGNQGMCLPVLAERRKSVITAIVTQKGGAGKTTIALNMAAALASDGRKVLLVDADPQQTAQDWAAIRSTPPPFQVIGLSKPILHRDLPKLARDYDEVIIDGAPRNYEVARSAIAAADLVLIPVQPSGADFWAARETVALVKEAHGFKEIQKSYFVVSRKIGRTVLSRSILEALATFELPILKAGTSQRIIYAETMTAGSTVIETHPYSDASFEIRRILKELTYEQARNVVQAPGSSDGATGGQLGGRGRSRQDQGKAAANQVDHRSARRSARAV